VKTRLSLVFAIAAYLTLAALPRGYPQNAADTKDLAAQLDQVCPQAVVRGVLVPFLQALRRQLVVLLPRPCQLFI
jgi:hypothetical protein